MEKYTIDFLNQKPENVLKELNQLAESLNDSQSMYKDLLLKYDNLVQDNNILRYEIDEYDEAFKNMGTGVEGLFDALYLSKKNYDRQHKDFMKD